MVEYGAKYNPRRHKGELPDTQWLTLPIFRYRQKGGTAQDLLSQVRELHQQGYKLHGHALASKRNMPRFQYVEEFRGYFAGLTKDFEFLDSWDVANELTGVRQNRYGASWQLKLFEYARELLPKAELWYNVYAIKDPGHWGRIMTLAPQLAEQGIATGVGLQCHHDLRPKTRAFSRFETQARVMAAAPEGNELQRKIKQLQELGLQVIISEFTCQHPEGEEHLSDQLYASYQRLCKNCDVARLIKW